MSYTITNNIMYIRNEVGELVPVSMIASGADQTIQAIKNTAAEAESQIDTKVADANAAIETKTDEQAARIPEVTTLAEDVNGLKGDVVQLAEDMIGKLSEPAEGLAVGKYFRVAALDANGHAVLEAVDLPIAAEKNAGIVQVSAYDGWNMYGNRLQARTIDSIYYAGTNNTAIIGKGTLNNILSTPSVMPPLTADEQAAARERIGLDGDYEVLLDITVEEDCILINVTTDANGNPFRLKEALLYSYLPASDKSGNYGMELFYNNSTFGYATSLAMNATNNTYSKHFAQLHNGLWMCGGTNMSHQNEPYSTTALVLIMPIITKSDAPYIDRIRISQLNSGTIKAGARIKLMGVRA